MGAIIKRCLAMAPEALLVTAKRALDTGTRPRQRAHKNTETTMLDASTHVALARELHEAQRTRVQLGHFSLRHPAMTIEDSYAIQAEWMKLCLAEGRRVIGHKIGLTSRAMQLASQITEPDYGTLLDSMLLRDGGEVEAARFIVPRFEVEFAFVLGRPLRGPAVTLFEAGEIVLGGSFTRPVACAAGDTFRADYGSLGSITMRFV
jgi:2-keto-4-pentenoate hydratase